MDAIVGARLSSVGARVDIFVPHFLAHQIVDVDFDTARLRQRILDRNEVFSIASFGIERTWISGNVIADHVSRDIPSYVLNYCNF